MLSGKQEEESHCGGKEGNPISIGSSFTCTELQKVAQAAVVYTTSNNPYSLLC